MADDTQESNVSPQAHEAAIEALQPSAGDPGPERHGCPPVAVARHAEGTLADADDHEVRPGTVATAATDGEGASTEALPSGGVDEPRVVVAREIDKGVERILAAFEAKLAYDATKQAQIDRLHEELQQHRGDLVGRAARPLVHGIIRLHDDICKLASALREKPANELTPDRFFSLLEGLQEDVEIVLGQNGVATYREPTGPFNPRRQRVLKKVSTAEEALTGMVAESIRPGFEQGTEILEKERVATYEFAQPPAGTPGKASEEEAAKDNVSSLETQEKKG